MRKIIVLGVLLISILLVVAGSLTSYVLRPVDFTLWINNYETEQCYDRSGNEACNWEYDRMYVDGEKVHDDLIVEPGKTWVKELSLKEGEHEVVFERDVGPLDDGGSWTKTIKLTVKENTCLEIAFSKHVESYPGYTHTHNCP